MAFILTHISKVTRFTLDAAGIEKTLRLLQSICHVIAAYSLGAAATPWWLARGQLALGRRYLRWLKWYECAEITYARFISTSGVTALLEVGKWSCLGMFLGLESLTILDAMGVWTASWAAETFVQAMRFWFFSLLFSIALSVWQLWGLTAPDTPTQKAGKSAAGKSLSDSEAKAVALIKTRELRTKRREIILRIFVDVFDLLVPGSITGWLITSPATVGMSSVASTLLSSGDIWNRVNKRTTV